MADPDSIRVAGTTDDHPARINDLTVDLVPNIYSGLRTTIGDDEETEDEEDTIKEPESLVLATEKLEAIQALISETNERKGSTQEELGFLNTVCHCALFRAVF